jgi:hypothetical protein
MEDEESWLYGDSSQTGDGQKDGEVQPDEDSHDQPEVRAFLSGDRIPTELWVGFGRPLSFSNVP